MISSKYPLTLYKELAKVDKYRYDEAWERDCDDILHDFFEVKDMLSLICYLRSAGNLSLQDVLTPKADVSIIDLRQPQDFVSYHLPGSINLPVAQASSTSPFFAPAVMTALWTQLENTFSNPDENSVNPAQNKRVLVLCYDGDSARVATSILRAKGYVADSVKGGFSNFGPLDRLEVGSADVGPWLKNPLPMESVNVV